MPQSTMNPSILHEWHASGGPLVFLTGAGISAESGIPTFRGPGGFWTVGSKNYSPMELATRAAFSREPETVWQWYLWRFARCASAEPNAAHYGVARLQSQQAGYGERVVLITQNVDGLHQRAGSPEDRTFPVHGDARFMRCSRGCHPSLATLPALDALQCANVACGAELEPMSKTTREALTCKRCGGWMRPHVLWFDEYYDETHYRAQSALIAAGRARLLVVIGTAGATSLPMRIGVDCAARGVPIVDVNVEDNAFAELASKTGFAMREPATTAVMRLVELLLALRSR